MVADSFVTAKNKLKLAEKFSDLNSDEDTDIDKKKRRLHAAKVVSSSSSEEECNKPVRKNRKIDKYPDVPQNIKHSGVCKSMLDDTEHCEAENEIQDIHDENHYQSVSHVRQVKGKLLLHFYYNIMHDSK